MQRIYLCCGRSIPMLKKLSEKIIKSCADDKYRRHGIFNVLNILLTAVSGVMAAVNFATGEERLAIAAGAFAVLCLGNYLSVKAGFVRADISAIVFSAEAMLLVVFFIVSGKPEGFSVLWTLLVPATTRTLDVKGNIRILETYI